MLVLTTLAEAAIPKSESLPQLDISVKTLKNPNEHIFATKKHNKNKFDYHKIQVDNKDRQPVLFEHMTQIHLTRSKYIITSYLNFDEYYKGFNQLENFVNKLYTEVTKLSETEMTYFIRRYSGKQSALEDIFETHKKEVASLIQTLEVHKTQFNKLLDHMTTSSTTDTTKQARQVK